MEKEDGIATQSEYSLNSLRLKFVHYFFSHRIFSSSFSWSMLGVDVCVCVLVFVCNAHVNVCVQ